MAKKRIAQTFDCGTSIDWDAFHYTDAGDMDCFICHKPIVGDGDHLELECTNKNCAGQDTELHLHEECIPARRRSK